MNNVIAVAAIGEKGELGVGDRLPWKSCEPAQFRRLVRNGFVICGFRTAVTLPKSVQFRAMLVVADTKRKDTIDAYYDFYTNRLRAAISGESDNRLLSNGIDSFIDRIADLPTAIAYAKRVAKSGEPIYVIGGAKIFNQALEEKLVDGVILSNMRGTYPDATAYLSLDALRANYKHAYTTCPDLNVLQPEDPWLSTESWMKNSPSFLSRCTQGVQSWMSSFIE